MKKSCKNAGAPYLRKNKTKVLGREFERTPFSKGVLSIISIKLLYKYYGYGQLFFYIVITL